MEWDVLWAAKWAVFLLSWKLSQAADSPLSSPDLGIHLGDINPALFLRCAQDVRQKCIYMIVRRPYPQRITTFTNPQDGT
jgi:hypothetical protein